MVAVQVDGLSGTGKSTLAAELINRGQHAVDADADFAYFGDPVTGRPSDARIRAHWIWDLPRLRDFCAAQEANLVYVCGGALNQEQCSELFAQRFLLVVDDATMRHRLLTRGGDGYGRAPYELTEQLELNRTAIAEGRRTGRVIIDATRPLGTVADEIIDLSRHLTRSPGPR